MHHAIECLFKARDLDFGLNAREAHLGTPSSVPKCESVEVPQGVYTNGTPTQANNREQPRDARKENATFCRHF